MKFSPDNVTYYYPSDRDDPMKETLTYDDVLLVPQYSNIRSRSEVNIGSVLDGPHAMLRLSLPIISSPMDTISEEEMGIVMWEHGSMVLY